VEAGFGTPREAMRLVKVGPNVRLLTVKTERDVTSQLRQLAERRVIELEREELSGYVLKKDSPSCGLERVKVYGASGMPSKSGRGVFAASLVAHFPSLPVEEEGRLADPRLRENFVERVFAYARLRALFTGRWTIGKLIVFHTAHKLTLMSHSTAGYETLGRLVAGARRLERSELMRRYSAEFMRVLTAIATPRRHANVLQHMAGYFKRVLDRESKDELLATIEQYRCELVPLIVPVTLVRHYVRVHRVAYLAGQHYLEPHPRELMLRNHV
jgi:uncharacterized protein YbgA (DUF1722 family)